MAYKQGNIHAFFKTLTDGADGTSEYKATSFGGKMKFGSMDVALQLESTEKGTTEEDYMFLNFNMKMGKNVITANYGTYEDNAATVNETTKLTLGVTHKFSKKTRAFVAHSVYDYTAGSATSDYTVTSLGLRVDI